MKILASIVHDDEGTRLKQYDERDKFRRDVLKILKQLEQQMQVEKEREQNLDQMYP